MRIHILLLGLPIVLFPFTALQKPGAKPPEKPAEKAASEAPGLVPTQFLAPIENVVRQLAKGGREREAKDLIAAMDKLGYPKANIDKLEKLAKEDLTKAKSAIDALPAGAKQLRLTAKQLVAIMEKLEDGEPKSELARGILMLDGESEAARAVLGHVKVGKSWVMSEFAEMRARRGAILTKVGEAKKLPVDIETAEVDDEIIQKIFGVKASMAKRGMIELHSNFSIEKTERILREVSRALALSNWLRGKTEKGKENELALPPNPKKVANRRTWVLIDSREKFNKLALDTAAANEMEEDDVKLMQQPNSQMGAFDIKKGPRVVLAQWEHSVLANLLVYLSGMKTEGIQTPLTAGHLNWLTLSCFGCTLPNYVVKEEFDRHRGGTFVETEDDKREREELMRLAKAGIAGSRTWMQWLVEHGEDPPFRSSLVEALGLITGNDLHKCTSVIDFLQEASSQLTSTENPERDPNSPNILSRLYTKVGTAEVTRNPVDSYNTALSTIGEGWTFGEMETKWRAWILGDRKGVAERIDKENLNAWPADALFVLDYMNDIREKTFKGKIEGVWKLKFDPELSENCALHAQYLEKHPEQQKWPDAHEEYADKEGYTVEGAWAGTHSVILFGGTGEAKDSIDGFMGTFYHRLPLIDPGVLRLGWGKEELNTVMDMGSLAAPYEKPYVIVYPYDGQPGVPTKFSGNEHPDPIPDPEVEPGMVVEEEIYGYPVTIQTNPVNENGETIDIVMKLFEGKDAKSEVECFFSTPSKPTNPESAPGGAWCLIPKTHLKPKTDYKVIADWNTGGKGTKTAAGKHMEWTFKTE